MQKSSKGYGTRPRGRTGKIEADMKILRKRQYSTGLSLQVPSFLAEYGAIENLDFVWTERNFG
jgi:hypothetical protein